MFISPVSLKEIEKLKSECADKVSLVSKRNKVRWEDTQEMYRKYLAKEAWKNSNQKNTTFGFFVNLLANAEQLFGNKKGSKADFSRMFLPLESTSSSQQLQQQRCRGSSNFSEESTAGYTTAAVASFDDEASPVGSGIEEEVPRDFVVMCKLNNAHREVLMECQTTQDRYIGQVNTWNQPHGEGEMFHQNQTYYIGQFKDGKKHGKGEVIFNDGRHYKGEFQHDKRHGTGVFVWTDGRKYIGMYNNDQKEGKGVHIWPSKAKFIGMFKNNKRSGFGIYVWDDHKCYCGEYLDDLRDGKGVMFYPKSTSSTSSSSASTSPSEKKHSKRWVMGIYKNGKPLGEFFCVREDGTPWVEIFTTSSSKAVNRYVWCYDRKLHTARQANKLTDISIICK